jgi:hypothetical protein
LFLGSGYKRCGIGNFGGADEKAEFLHGGAEIFVIHRLGQIKIAAQCVATFDLALVFCCREHGYRNAAHNAVKVESRWRDANLVIHIYAPLPIDGLTLAMPAGFYPLPTQPIISEVNGQSVVLAGLQGSADIVLKRPVSASGTAQKPCHIVQVSAPVDIQLR